MVKSKTKISDENNIDSVLNRIDIKLSHIEEDVNEIRLNMKECRIAPKVTVTALWMNATILFLIGLCAIIFVSSL